MNEQKYNKENIKDRMVKTAMHFWGIDKSESLDPLVSLLIEALSSEIYTLSNEVATIEARLLDKLAEILIPGTKTTALPAHAIAYTQPIEAEYVLKKGSSLFYEDFNFNRKNKVKSMYFTTICDTHLKKGMFRYMIYNGICASLDKNMSKNVIERLAIPDSTSTVWVALDMDQAIGTLKDLSFYLDFPNLNNRSEYSRLLPFTVWSVNGKDIKIRTGLNTAEAGQHELMKRLSQYDTVNQIDRDVCNLYNSRFISIDDDFQFKRMKYPLELEKFITSSENLRQEFCSPLLWIRIQFPPVFLSEILEDITISINAFPIVQKLQKSINVKLDELTNIIPLVTNENEYFLSVKSVRDAHGRRYLELSDKEGVGEEQGYSIRHGGCERFDTRDARDYLVRLLDLLNEESATFSSIFKGKNKELTEEMFNLINRMKINVSDISEKREITNYLIMDTPSVGEVIISEYWITNGANANGIRSGLSLAPGLGVEIQPLFTFLMTSTIGGKQPLSPQEKIGRFKNTLISRDRIITPEDIKDFCMMEYPDIITDVKVERGLAQSGKPHGGLTRTIDVCIHTNGTTMHEMDKDNLYWNLSAKLRNRSPETFNYRLFIDKI